MCPTPRARRFKPLKFEYGESNTIFVPWSVGSMMRRLDTHPQQYFDLGVIRLEEGTTLRSVSFDLRHGPTTIDNLTFSLSRYLTSIGHLAVLLSRCLVSISPSCLPIILPQRLFQSVFVDKARLRPDAYIQKVQGCLALGQALIRRRNGLTRAMGRRCSSGRAERVRTGVQVKNT